MYEQNNTVNSVHADDRTAELATIAGNEIVYDAQISKTYPNIPCRIFSLMFSFYAFTLVNKYAFQ